MAGGLRDVLSLQGVTFPSSNVSSELVAGFEVKEGKDSAFLHIAEATFDTQAFLSLQLGNATKEITAAQAKKLPGVTAAETVTVYCEIFIDSLNGNNAAGLQVEFFDDSAVQKGSTVDIEISESGEWQQIRQEMVVPTDATRVNFLIRAACDGGDTVQMWCAHLRLAR